MNEIIEVLKREFVYVWYYFWLQLRQIFPYWILGMVIGSVISVFVKDKIHGAVSKMGEHKLGVLGIVFASILELLHRYACTAQFRLLLLFREKESVMIG